MLGPLSAEGLPMGSGGNAGDDHPRNRVYTLRGKSTAHHEKVHKFDGRCGRVSVFLPVPSPPRWEETTLVRGRPSSWGMVLSPTARETLARWPRSTTLAAGLARRGQLSLLRADRSSQSSGAQRVGVHRGVVRTGARRCLAQRLAGRADAPGRGAKGGVAPRGREPRGTPDPVLARSLGRVLHGRVSGPASPYWTPCPRNVRRPSAAFLSGATLARRLMATTSPHGSPSLPAW